MTDCSHWWQETCPNCTHEHDDTILAWPNDAPFSFFQFIAAVEKAMSKATHNEDQ